MRRLEVRGQEVAALQFMKFEALPSLFDWKDAAYFFNHDPDGSEMRVIDLQNSTCSEAEMGFSLDSRMFDLRREETGPTAPGELLFGDETFISVFEPGFCVWCFDTNVPMFKEEIAYKEKRKSNMERWLRIKDDSCPASELGSRIL